MKSKDTLNDFKNQLARQQMEAGVAMGVRRVSYEDFKRKARAHQIDFRENELEVGFDTFPNVMPKSKAISLIGTAPINAVVLASR